MPVEGLSLVRDGDSGGGDATGGERSLTAKSLYRRIFPIVLQHHSGKLRMKVENGYVTVAGNEAAQVTAGRSSAKNSDEPKAPGQR